MPNVSWLESSMQGETWTYPYRVYMELLPLSGQTTSLGNSRNCSLSERLTHLPCCTVPDNGKGSINMYTPFGWILCSLPELRLLKSKLLIFKLSDNFFPIRFQPVQTLLTTFSTFLLSQMRLLSKK